jgi:hypothetical protein
MLAQTAKRELEQLQSRAAQEFAAQAPFATAGASTEVHGKQPEKCSIQQYGQIKSKSAAAAAAAAAATTTPAVFAEPQSAVTATAMQLGRADAVGSIAVPTTAGTSATAGATAVDDVQATVTAKAAPTDAAADTATAAAAGDKPAVSANGTSAADNGSSVLQMVLQQLNVPATKRQCVLLLGCSNSTLATNLAQAGEWRCTICF